MLNFCFFIFIIYAVAWSAREILRNTSAKDSNFSKSFVRKCRNIKKLPENEKVLLYTSIAKASHKTRRADVKITPIFSGDEMCA